MTYEQTLETFRTELKLKYVECPLQNDYQNEVFPSKRLIRTTVERIEFAFC